MILLAFAGVLLAVAVGHAAALPDLAVANADVDTDVRSPTQGNTVTLEATVHNTGDANATAFTLRFMLDGSTTLANVAVTGLAAGASANITASWAVGGTSTGSHTLEAIADATVAVSEGNEANNRGSHDFEVNAPPTAAATVSGTGTQLTLTTFTFGGGTSSDSDGTVVSYLWLFDDGSTSNLTSPTHQYLDGAAGAGKLYTITLIVTDDDGGTSSDQVSVHVTNRGPVADATDVSGNTKTALVFSGTGSSDPDGRIVNATWAFSDGVTLYGLTVLRSFDDNGAYTAQLTVVDDDGASSSTPINIEIFNQAPTAVISTSPVMPFQPNSPAFFEGRNSFDVDGGITNYTWVFPGGVNVYGWNATHSFPVNGTYNVTLVLVDDDGVIGQLTIAALVGNDTIGTRVPTPPVGRIGVSALTVLTGQPVSFDASNSTDDTGIISYLWDFGDQTTGVGVVVSHAWPVVGNYRVTLNVTDTDGNSSFAFVTIHVMDRPPVASILASPTVTQTLTLIAFDGGSSSDADGTVILYKWDFGDSTVVYGRSVTHTYARAGNFTVTLTVTDSDGVKGSATTVVWIQNRAPKAVAPANFSVPTFEEHLFDASGSFDLDGVVQSYTWNFGDGTVVNGRSVKHAFASINSAAIVTLTVRDDLGATGQTTMTVNVTNNGPSVTISGPLAIYTGDTAAFTAVAVDRDGSIASWDWRFGEGGSSNLASPVSHAYPTKGTYVVTLTVGDNWNPAATGTATFTIEVMNRLPTAKIASPAAGFTAASLTAVSFSASGSTDPETPNNLEYFWIFGDGGVAGGSSVSHAFSRAGTFTVILTVSDPDGGAASATTPVVISNQGPTSVPAVNLTTAQTLESITFDGTGSRDPDGTVQSFLWDFGDGSTSSSKVAAHIFKVAPEAPETVYHVKLTVFDNLGASASATVDVTIQNRLPIGVIENGEPLFASLTTFFRATGSHDTDGLVISYAWLFGDGGEAKGSETSHIFAGAGTFNVTLTVTDNRGGVTTVTKEVIVQAKPNYGIVGGNGTTTKPAPGFESAGAVVAVAAAACLAFASRRRRQA